MRHILQTIFALSTCLLLVSCIEIKEEIQVNKDLSGTVEFSISGPGVVLASHGEPEKLIEKFRELIDQADDIAITHTKVTRHAGQTNIDLHLSFENARDFVTFLQNLPELKEPEQQPAINQLIGKLDLSIDFPNYHFTRKLDFSPLADGKELSPVTQSLLADANFTSIMHLPNGVKSHNATELSGNSMTWNIPLTELLEGEQEISYTGSIPLPWWIYVGVGIVLTLVVWGGFYLRKKYRKKQ